jgi:hypothetical protein
MNSKTKLLRELDFVFPKPIFYSLPPVVKKYIRNAHDLVIICINEKMDENKKILSDTTELRKQLNKVKGKYK